MKKQWELPQAVPFLSTLIAVTLVLVALTTGYGYAQQDGPWNNWGADRYMQPFPRQDLSANSPVNQQLMQQHQQRFQYQPEPSSNWNGIQDDLYRQQMLDEQRSQSNSLYNMEMQNTKPNACGLLPSYRYARPGC